MSNVYNDALTDLSSLMYQLTLSTVLSRIAMGASTRDLLDSVTKPLTTISSRIM